MTEDEIKYLAVGQKGLLDILSRSYPKHTVEVQAFYCDLYEVTNAQWAHYLNVTGQEPSSYLVEFAWKARETYPEREANFPIRNVSLHEAREFARWCGKRLPTEAEWMRAAAGDDGRIYAWGNDWNRGKHCNSRNRLSPVGSYPSGVSPFGIHDMTGSVWEWTISKFQQYPKYKPIDIKIGKKKVFSQPRFNARQYVIKGGHYLAGELANRLAIREAALPSDSVDSVGFRCIKDASAGKCMLSHALKDLEGACLDEEDIDPENLFIHEIALLTKTEPALIDRFDYFLLCGREGVSASAQNLINDDGYKIFSIGLLSTSKPLESPKLPPGSYIMAYCHDGLSAVDKKRREQIKKIEEELKRRAEERERLKREKGVSIRKDDVIRDKEELKRLDEIKKEDEEIKKKEAERRAQLEKIGLISGAGEQIDFPRNENLIVFMNAKERIKGYVRTRSVLDVAQWYPPKIYKNGNDGRMIMELNVKSLKFHGSLQFHIEIRMKDNLFE
jgi:hypothetical protein